MPKLKLTWQEVHCRYITHFTFKIGNHHIYDYSKAHQIKNPTSSYELKKHTQSERKLTI